MVNRKNIVVEVGSICVFTLGVFTLFSLTTYYGADSSLFSSGTQLPHNYCGRIGAYIASAGLNYFGMGGFLLPASLFFIAATIHKRGGIVSILGTIGGMAIAVGSLTVFLALQWKYWTYGGSVLLTGGVFGTWVADGLLHELNFLGSSLVTLLIFTLSLAISTPLSLAQWGAKLIRAFSILIGRLLRLGITYSFYCMSVLVIHWLPMFGGFLSKVTKALLKTAQNWMMQIHLKESKGFKGSQGPKGNDAALVLAKSTFVPAEVVPVPVSIPKMKPENTSPEHMSTENTSSDTEALDEDAIDLSAMRERLTEEAPEKVKGITILPRQVDATSKPLSKGEKNPSKTKRGQWQLPTVEFLKNPPPVESAIDRDRLISNSHILKQKFADFGIDGEVTAVRPGPVITLYEFKPGPGVKVSRIAALVDDLSMALSAQSVRILAPLPGKSVVGIEIPSDTREMVYLREFLQHPDFYGPKHSIPVVMGKDIGGQTYLSDLARMPHLLCAGQTGSGKSVFMNGLICSLFYRFTPDELRMILVDPKFIEFRSYQDIPHLLLPVVDDPKQASTALKWAVREMERRYRILAKMGARNLATFNQKIEEMGSDVVKDLLYAEDVQSEISSVASGGDWIEAFEPDDTGAPRVSKLPYIVVIIDELADLMMIAKKEVEISIARIAQKARAAGIHLIIATQRPSTDVITGLIKANLPSRVSFQLASYVDSKTILDRAGAERLLGQGDMLFIPPGVSQNLRLHGAFLEDEEINKITTFLRSQGKPAYRDEILLADDDDENEQSEMESEDDHLFQEGVQLVKHSGHASASFLQRHLKIGYNRAARMIETMETRGIVGPADGARPREVLMR